MKKQSPTGSKAGHEKTLPRYFFLLQVAVALACVAAFYVTLHKFVDRSSPVLNKITDMQFSDLAFVHGRSKVSMDNRIVIVNCIEDGRKGIAEKIAKIDSCGARVIGVDIVFTAREDTNTSVLRSVLDTLKAKVVLARHTDERRILDTAVYDSTFTYGYLSLLENRLETKREFHPWLAITKDSSEGVDKGLAFAAAVLKVYDSGKFKLLLQEGENIYINYKKPHADSRYRIIHTLAEIRDAKKEIMDRIVIVGAWDSLSLEDRHYTPLNGHLGRSWPDMNGTEYHGQVLSMALDADYLKTPYKLVKYLLIFIFSMGWIAYVKWLHKKMGNVDHFLAELTVCLVTLVAVVISSFCLDNFDLLVEPLDYLIPMYLSGLFHRVIHYYYKHAKSH